VRTNGLAVSPVAGMMTKAAQSMGFAALYPSYGAYPGLAAGPANGHEGLSGTPEYAMP
jgi:hypothetical protein